ncbi:MAG: hypothetical protein ACJ74Y_11380 [Bryobacteraceae bacterium]
MKSLLLPIVLLELGLAMTAQTTRTLPDPLYGLTLDDVSSVSTIAASISALPRMPISRLVFDEETTPADYRNAIKALYPVSYLMGELLDSEYMSTISAANYAARTSQFLNAFRGQVDVWEVGNEVNGEWLGRTSDVVSKISASYNVVSAAGQRTGLTLYYNPNCWSNRSNEMLPWAQANIPAAMKAGLNYVLVSYYEGDCNNYRPSPAEWTQVFEKLHTMFPNAKLGFGETGMSKPIRSTTLSKAQSILNYYYKLKIPVPGYVGGGFWWYAAEDIVPMDKPFWASFSNALASSPF